MFSACGTSETLPFQSIASYPGSDERSKAVMFPTNAPDMTDAAASAAHHGGYNEQKKKRTFFPRKVSPAFRITIKDIDINILVCCTCCRLSRSSRSQPRLHLLLRRRCIRRGRQFTHQAQRGTRCGEALSAPRGVRDGPFKPFHLDFPQLHAYRPRRM